MMKSNNFVKKAVFKNFKANLVMTLRFSAIISFVLLLLYALCAIVFSIIVNSNSYSISQGLVGLIFLILVCYILEPFFYSYFAMTVLLNSPSRDDVRMSGYFKTLTIGFSKPVLKALCLPTNLIYSALIFFGANLVLGTLTFEVLSNVNEAYKTLFSDLTNLYLAGNVDNLNEYLINNEALIIAPLIYVQFAATLLSFYFFLHRIGIYLMRYFMVPFTNGVPNNFSSYCFRKTLRMNRKYYYKNYYSIAWIYIPIILIIFSATYFLLYLLNVTSSYIILELTSIVVTILFILPLAPLLFNLYTMMVDKFGAMYTAVLNNRIAEEMKILKNNYENLSKDEQDQLNTILNSRADFKKLFDEVKPDKDDKKDDKSLSKNDSDKSDDSSKNDEEDKKDK